jgi:hypothetical protein
VYSGGSVTVRGFNFNPLCNCSAAICGFQAAQCRVLSFSKLILTLNSSTPAGNCSIQILQCVSQFNSRSFPTVDGSCTGVLRWFCECK